MRRREGGEGGGGFPRGEMREGKTKEEGEKKDGRGRERGRTKEERIGHGREGERPREKGGGGEGRGERRPRLRNRGGEGGIPSITTQDSVYHD